MLVYRLCNKEEVDNILNDLGFEKAGSICNINPNVNTHLYDNNKKYLHFFKEKNSIFHLNTVKDMCICIYDIPKELLKQKEGKGYYFDNFSFRDKCIIDEYAIENSLIDFNYLLKIDRIIDSIDIDDYVFDDISNKTEIIYINDLIKNKLSDKVNYDIILKLYSILMSDNIEKTIKENQEYLVSLIPEIKNIIGFEHKHPHHNLDVWEHTLYALSLSEKDFNLRIALLLHDIGKPFCFVEEKGVRHFPNHPVVSSQISLNLLTRLGFKNDYINKICYLIRLHDTPIKEEELIEKGDLIETRYFMQECDALAHNPEKLEKRKEYLDSVKKLILKK